MIEIQYTVTGLDELTRKLSPELIAEPMREFFLSATTEIKGEVQSITPRDMGRLWQSIHSMTDSQPIPLRGTVSTNVMYAPFVEEDTVPHDIFPKNKKALAFQSGGKLGRGTRRKGIGGMIGGGALVIVKHVHHPGTRGKHMFQRGLLTWTITRMESLLSQTARAIESKWNELR